MATSFLSKDFKVGFWIDDGIFSLSIRWLYDELLTNNKDKWLDKYIEFLERYYIRGGPIGAQSFGFQNLQKNQIESLVLCFEKIIENLEDCKYITKEELNSFESLKESECQYKWQSDLETKYFINLIQAIIYLLKYDKVPSSLNKLDNGDNYFEFGVEYQIG